MRNKSSYLATLLIAALVGHAFKWLGVTHGLLLGSLAATVVLAQAWAKPQTPPWVLPFIQIVLGLSTGLLFKSWAHEFSAMQMMSLAVMLLSLLSYMTLGFAWLYWVARWSRTDALLAVYPGALAAILDVFHVHQASNRVVLVHIVRLFVLTVLVTLLIPNAVMPTPSIEASWSVSDALALTALLIMIVGVGRLLRR